MKEVTTVGSCSEAVARAWRSRTVTKALLVAGAANYDDRGSRRPGGRTPAALTDARSDDAPAPTWAGVPVSAYPATTPLSMISGGEPSRPSAGPGRAHPYCGRDRSTGQVTGTCPATQFVLRAPRAVAVDDTGHAYVAHTGNQRVCVIEPDVVLRTEAS
jgi:hypothetical protein